MFVKIKKIPNMMAKPMVIGSHIIKFGALNCQQIMVEAKHKTDSDKNTLPVAFSPIKSNMLVFFAFMLLYMVKPDKIPSDVAIAIPPASCFAIKPLPIEFDAINKNLKELLEYFIILFKGVSFVVFVFSLVLVFIVIFLAIPIAKLSSDMRKQNINSEARITTTVLFFICSAKHSFIESNVVMPIPTFAAVNIIESIIKETFLNLDWHVFQLFAIFSNEDPKLKSRRNIVKINAAKVQIIMLNIGALSLTRE